LGHILSGIEAPNGENMRSDLTTDGQQEIRALLGMDPAGALSLSANYCPKFVSSNDQLLSDALSHVPSSLKF
jgi:hypothetical protein